MPSPLAGEGSSNASTQEKGEGLSRPPHPFESAALPLCPLPHRTRACPSSAVKWPKSDESDFGWAQYATAMPQLGTAIRIADTQLTLPPIMGCPAASRLMTLEALLFQALNGLAAAASLFFV